MSTTTHGVNGQGDEALREVLLEVLSRFGPDWDDVQGLVGRLLAVWGPARTWDEIGSLWVRAEVARSLGGQVPRPEPVALARVHAERVGVAVQWVLDHGRRFVIQRPEDVVAGLSLLRRHLGLRAGDARRRDIGVPRRFQARAEPVVGPSTQKAIEDRFRRLTGGDPGPDTAGG